MGLDINTKKLKKNAFRVSKVRGIGASRIRVPGGYLDARVLGMVQEIAQEYGNGFVHLTTRQGFEIEGIRLKDMEAINRKLQPIIELLEINQTEAGSGYPASGTRNISACIGSNVCPFANYNTAEMARRIEKAVYPNDLHFKIACTGCSNDCAKARMHDFGIIGMTMPQYDPDRCVNCQACVKGCKKLSVDALRAENYKIVRDTEKCIGCGVCVTKCPTRALTRSRKTYKFVEAHISPDAPARKEHIGYIVDRVGFEEYKKWALEGVELMPETVMKKCVYWDGIHFDR